MNSLDFEDIPYKALTARIQMHMQRQRQLQVQIQIQIQIQIPMQIKIDIYKCIAGHLVNTDPWPGIDCDGLG